MSVLKKDIRSFKFKSVIFNDYRYNFVIEETKKV